MKKETYDKMLEKAQKYTHIIQIMSRALTLLVMLFYVIVVLFGAIGKIFDTQELATVIFVPAVVFVCITVFRHVVNRPRPYEKFQRQPLIPKETHGKSFPSRHVGSAAVIGITVCMATPFFCLGISLLFATAIMAVLRVISGVHFISDVLAGYFVGVIGGILGMLLMHVWFM